ncbi:unnamed protein product [Polarella glacialis]|uniref:Uncharacterized protein n=1 Tax=Polarella glacialis TaxID=89957 RepID=A0A813HB33_POLGL|nr:unnamed protein product [Polarella glacialis]
MAASAFDLLRSSQLRSRHAPHFGEVAESVEASGSLDALRPRGRLQSGAVGTDERLGLWWLVQESELLFFPMPGPQWPPCAVQALPEEVSLSARCVAPLTGPVQQGPHGPHGTRGPSAVAVFADMRVAVFPHGGRVDLPRPAGMPLGQAPLFVHSAAAHPWPDAVGVVLVVGTQAGRLFSLFLRQNGDTFEAEAGSLWPCAPSEGGFRNLFKRVRRSLIGADSSQQDVDAASAEAPLLVQAVEVLAAPAGVGNAGALFAVLAWSEERLAYYAHPRSTAAAELLWSIPIRDLVTGGPSTRLLSVRFCQGADTDGLLVLFAGEVANAGSSSLLARLPWASRVSPPRSGADAISVGPAPPLQHPGSQTNGAPVSFLTTFGEGAVVAVRARGERYSMCMVRLLKDGLRVGEQQMVDTGIVGLALLPEGGVSTGHVQVLTPHGLLDVPQEMPDRFAVSQADEAALEKLSIPDSFLQVAHELYATGREAQSTTLCARGFSQHGAQAMLAAVEKRTQLLLDAPATSGARWRGVSDDAAARHLLFDKARDLEQWLCFLDEAGVWTRMGGAPNVVAAQQAAAEAGPAAETWLLLILLLLLLLLLLLVVLLLLLILLLLFLLLLSLWLLVVVVIVVVCDWFDL